jgi:hypothetical protein
VEASVVNLRRSRPLDPAAGPTGEDVTDDVSADADMTNADMTNAGMTTDDTSHDGLELPAAASSSPATPSQRVPSTSFDFLEGSYLHVVRTRLLNLVLISLAVVAIALVASQALRNAVDGAEINQRNERAADDISAAAAELDRQATDGVVTYDQLRSAIDGWAALASAPLEGVVDTARVLADLNAVGPEIDVRLVELSAPGNADTGAAAAQTQPAGTDGTLPTTAGAAPVTLKVEGSTPSSSTATLLQGMFSDPARFGYLSEVQVPFNCAASSCTFTLTAIVDPVALSQRPADIKAGLLSSLPEERR